MVHFASAIYTKPSIAETWRKKHPVSKLMSNLADWTFLDAVYWRGLAPEPRITDKQTLIEIRAWEDDRNANHAKADWQFTTADARIKLKNLYSSV